jgi:hypothetical protein
MSKVLTFRLRNAMLDSLALWLIASAFYYIQQLFLPSFGMGFDEGTQHKVLKYVVCMSLGIYFYIAARVYGLQLFLAFFATHFSPMRKPSPELFPCKLVSLFYMISGLSGSQLNSLPNNQLFLLSMGALWNCRTAFHRPSASSPPSSPRSST